MKSHFWGRVTIGLFVIGSLLVTGAGLSQARTGGFHGGGFRGGGGFHHASFHHAGFNHVRFHHAGFHQGFRPFFFHHPCCFGPRFFVGVGVGLPFVYPYAYPYAYPAYSSPVAEASAPPVYDQPEQAYWYYCRDSQGYYPYVKECPSGWLQVVPQSTPPPQ